MNLFSMAIADSSLDPAEINFLYELGLQKGFSKEYIDNVIANPHKARFVKPSTLLEAIDQLYDLVRMVLSDGKIHPHEVELCKSFAKRFGISEEIIDELIEKLIDQVNAGVPKQELIDTIKQTL